MSFSRQVYNLRFFGARGGPPPRGCPRRILSLILGTLQGVASRRNKSQQTFYLHIDTGTFEVAMRRSQKQKSWKRTAIKTATDSFRRILSSSRSDLPCIQCFFRTFSGCLMAVFAVTIWKESTYTCTSFRAIGSFPGIKSATLTWWLFGPTVRLHRSLYTVEIFPLKAREARNNLLWRVNPRKTARLGLCQGLTQTRQRMPRIAFDCADYLIYVHLL
jgi:hypothetical protein